MGPFETIELNAPGGIPDYCARFGAVFAELASKPVTPELWGKDNVGRAVASWGRSPSPQDILDKQRWRDDRLAALVAHKRAQSEAAMTRCHPGTCCRDPLCGFTPEQADRWVPGTRPGMTMEETPMAKGRKVIITCAVTGSIHTPSMSPHLPVTPERDRRCGDRRGRGRRGDRASACARSQGRPARPVAGGVRAVPAR